VGGGGCLEEEKSLAVLHLSREALYRSAVRCRPTRRALLLGVLACGPTLPALARSPQRPAPGRSAKRPLDLRLGRELLGDGTLPPTRAPLGPDDPHPDDPPSRSGLAIELRPARRGREEPAGGASEPAERDALATGLDRLGLEELVIRLIRPL
jgi:hypothetical protein